MCRGVTRGGVQARVTPPSPRLSVLHLLAGSRTGISASTGSGSPGAARLGDEEGVHDGESKSVQ